jgi:hypothetical protein
MKRQLIIFFLLLLSSNIFCQDDINYKTGKYRRIEAVKTIESFIDSNAIDSFNLTRYLVFVIHIYYDEKSDNKYCFTIGYIMNSIDLEYIEPEYFTIIKNKTILVWADKNFRLKDFNLFKLKEMNPEINQLVLNKLYPRKKGWISYQQDCSVFCVDRTKYRKTTFINDFKIPFNKYIYKYKP